MAEFELVTEGAFKDAGRRGRRAYANPRAVAAKFDRRTQRVVIRLDTGIEFNFDPKQAAGLRDAAANDLLGVTIEGVGSTLHFPRMDADFTVSRLLEGFLGPLEWTRRENRALASRENGRLGGRPKRDTATAD